jgi:O-antigen/teichoic acid export membrane protein
VNGAVRSIGDSDGDTVTVARNLSTRYLAIAAEVALGLIVLPLNVRYLGADAYGLWMLTGSVSAYFALLDLGYSHGVVKYVAHYRARADVSAINEILSTAFVAFTAIGLLIYLAIGLLALNIESFFTISAEQASVGRIVLLIVGLNVACGMAFSVYGGVINAFQRYDRNNVVAALTTILLGVVNVAVLLAGGGLVAVVAATTAVRLLAFVIYRANAYRIFPALRVRPTLFRRERLKEMTSFSAYVLMIDWSAKVNYSMDAVIIGAFLGTTAVAVWTIGQRIAEIAQRLANQLNDILFPTIVDHDSANRQERLQAIFFQGTRLSLASVLPIGIVIIALAEPLVRGWIGDGFDGSAIVVQLLAVVVIVRVANATGNTLLKGAGQHRLLGVVQFAAALANLGLSVGLLFVLGLPGVALGTLIPLALSGAFVLFPAACRRAGLPVRRMLVDCMWPAVWPALVMTVFLAATRHLVTDSLLAVAAESIAAGGIYAVTFLFLGLSAGDRRLYLSKLNLLAARWRLQPAPESI